MSRSQGPSSNKRKRPDLNSTADHLTEHERLLYDAIRSKQGMGMSSEDVKSETNVPANLVSKSLKSLQTKNLIKVVVNIQSKGWKHYMASEFEPSKQISGGAWYAGGSLDTEFITLVREQCVKHVFRLKLATLEGVSDLIRRSGVFAVDLSNQQIEEIMKALVLDNEITELKSNGSGEFASIPTGKTCYKCVSKGGGGGEPKTGALASIPCGVCPQISLCTPDGIISPTTCVYYTKWLDF